MTIAQDRAATERTAVEPAEAGSHTAAFAEDLCQFIIARVGHEEFGLDVLSVQEINRLTDITPVPKAPPYVEGVINLRGRIIPALNLRRRFGLPPIERTSRTRIIVAMVHQRMVGLLVDSVVEVLRLSKSAIEPPPLVGASAGSEFTQGVGRIGDRLLIILDLNRLLQRSSDAAEPTGS